jgi:SAM-dependent methyltransferase
LLELGCGGGSLASHLKARFDLTLTDYAPGMLAVSRALNPDCEHLLGDMRTLRLARQFDVVLIHDAIMYATDAASVQATLETAATHCRPGGTVIVLPDYVRETFTPGTEEGGHDASDGRGLRYLEWRWDPDPNDDTYVVDYAFLLRDVSGDVRVVHDRHVEGLFTRARWFEWFECAGLSAKSDRDQWGVVVTGWTTATSSSIRSLASGWPTLRRIWRVNLGLKPSRICCESHDTVPATRCS